VPEIRIAPPALCSPPFNLSRLKNVYDDYPPRKEIPECIPMFAKKKKYNATQGNPEKKKGIAKWGYIAKKKKFRLPPPQPRPPPRKLGKNMYCRLLPHVNVCSLSVVVYMYVTMYAD
jgi:hypothetical protein